jgi:hypothetical protein
VEAVAFSSSLGACSSFCRAGREGDGCRHGDAVQPASGAQGRLPRGRARFGSLAQIRRRFRSRSRRPEAKMRTRLAGTSRAGTPETGIRPAESARAVAGPPRERPSGQQEASLQSSRHSGARLRGRWSISGLRWRMSLSQALRSAATMASLEKWHRAAIGPRLPTLRPCALGSAATIVTRPAAEIRMADRLLP